MLAMPFRIWKILCILVALCYSNILIKEVLCAPSAKTSTSLPYTVFSSSSTNSNPTFDSLLLRLRGGEGQKDDEIDDDGVEDKKQQQGQQLYDDFEILEDKVVYSGWRTVTQRKVRMRNGKVVTFDVSFSFFGGRIYQFLLSE